MVEQQLAQVDVEESQRPQPIPRMVCASESFVLTAAFLMLSCGGGSATAPSPAPIPIPTPIPEPTPTPVTTSCSPLPPGVSRLKLKIQAKNREFWDVDPFEGVIKDGCIWGRGALDMKGMGVLGLMVMLLFKRHGIQPSRDLIFLAVADEEALLRVRTGCGRLGTGSDATGQRPRN